MPGTENVTNATLSAASNDGTTRPLELFLLSAMFSFFLILIVAVFLIWHYHRRARDLLYSVCQLHSSQSGSSNSVTALSGSSQVIHDERRQRSQLHTVQIPDQEALPFAPDELAQMSATSSDATMEYSSSRNSSPCSRNFPVYEFMRPIPPFMDAQRPAEVPPNDFLHLSHHLSDSASRVIDSSVCSMRADTGAVASSSSMALDYNIRLMDLELRDLGIGASGRVKEAIYVTSDGEVHHVAAKYARDSSKHFRDELDIISKLPPHDNIVKYYGGRFSGQMAADRSEARDYFIVMELMFTNLEEIIHGKLFGGDMNHRLILKISLDIINGLGHLHANGIIHYDLKPSNVLLDEDFVAKLADFGSSKKRFRSQTTASLRGTMGYIAPEVLLGHFVRSSRVSEKLDIFSLGVVMWEMVTGEHPPNPDHSFSSSFQDSFTCSKEIVTRRLSSSSFLNASTDRCPLLLRSLIEECLSIEPEMRPSTEEIKIRLLETQTLLNDDQAEGL